MKTEHKILIVWLVAGVSVWCIDAALDSLVFYEKTFLELLILSVPPRELQDRVVALLAFAVAGAIAASFARRRRLAEEALRQFGREKAAILDSMAEHVVYHGPDMVIQWANRAAAESVNRTPAELVGTHCYQLWHQRDVACEGCPVVQTMQDGQPHDSEVTTPDGGVWLVRGYPVRDERSRVVGAVEATQEITARVRASEALRKSEAQLRFVTDQVTDLVWAMDLEETFTFVTPSVEAILGYTVEEALALTLGQVLTGEGHQRAMTEISRRLTEPHNPMVTLELDHVCKDGSSKPCEVTAAFLLDETGERRGIIGVSRDISERKRAQEALRDSELRYRTTLDAMGDAIHVVDERLRIVLINKAIGGWCDELGLPKDLTGQAVFEAFPFLSEKIRQEYHQVFRTGEVLVTEETTDIDGRTVITDTRKIPVLEGGKVARVVTVIRDVTERKRAEEALRESREKARAQFRGLPVPTYTWQRTGEDFVLVDYNDAAAAITHGKVADFVGTRASQMYAKAPDIREELSRCFTERAPIGREMTYRFLTTGEEKSLAVKYAFVPPDLVLVHTEDITERKEAEQALRESEENFRALVENAMDGIAIVARDGRILYANERAAEIVNCSAEELIGMNVRDVIHQEMQQEFLGRMERRLAGETVPPRYETRVARKDGPSVPVEVLATTTVWHGQSAIMASVRDLTERRQAEKALRESEENFRALAENSLDGILILTGQGRAAYVNASASEILGYSPQELREMDIWQVPPPGVREQVQERYRARMAGDPVPELLETEVVRKDGRTIPVEVSGAITVWRGEQADMCTLRDITERKRAEDALREQEQQLRQAETMAAVGRLAGGIAHDFNNMLGIIKGYAELLSKTIPPGDQRRADLETIRNASERAASLTRQLLALGRKQVVQPRVLDLNESVMTMESLLRRTIGHGIELRTLPAEDLWCVKADPAQLEQVILNLVANACEAMPEGGQVTIETHNLVIREDAPAPHPEISPGEYAVLAVSDTGVGMDEEVRAHMFEPFFTTKSGGTGLGLSTCYGIVEQSGGRIAVDSEPGRGSIFRVYLPRLRETVPQEPSVATAGPDRQLPRGSETVLVVEDEPAARELTQRILSDHGYQVLTAAGAEEAIAVAMRQPTLEIHLLVTDVVMPRMNGSELAQRFEALRPHARVLFVSGYPDDALVDRGVMPAGMNLLSKPFSPAQLIEAVRRALDARPARRGRPKRSKRQKSSK